MFLIGNHYLDNQEYQKAINKYTLSLEIYQRALDHKWHKCAELYLRIGRIYENKGNDAEANRNFKHGLDLFEIYCPNATIEKAVLYDCYGRTLSKLSHNFLAIEYFLKAIDMYNQLRPSNHTERSIYFYECIGKAYLELKDLKRSFHYNQKALDLRMIPVLEGDCSFKLKKNISHEI